MRERDKPVPPERVIVIDGGVKEKDFWKKYSSRFPGYVPRRDFDLLDDLVGPDPGRDLTAAMYDGTVRSVFLSEVEYHDGDPEDLHNRIGDTRRNFVHQRDAETYLKARYGLNTKKKKKED